MLRPHSLLSVEEYIYKLLRIVEFMLPIITEEKRRKFKVHSLLPTYLVLARLYSNLKRL